MEATVEVQVDLESIKVKNIHLQTNHIFGPPTDRPKLTEDEKAKAIEIAEADPNIQKILSHGFTLCEPCNSHPALGVDPRRVVWLSFEGDMASDEYRGVIVNLDDEDVIVMWEGELPSWWPY
jgi:hypothetical protein